ncbi:uncharacterized protein LOC112638822 [Camponotus floridanus]|uniref:uncharacterized protein LOC112638822 n=1 Tax=Camponotus floridanus TaxID=104421 RepID=UPI000DC680E2|nr:uncharacterized protein LOC112638822 [Camponotus floridanus]
MSTEHGTSRSTKYWAWDYFSIKEDSISISVCDICAPRTMETHLKDKHNVTKNEWECLQNWRDTNLTKKYYNLTQEKGELIKRTKKCTKCDHEFQRSNLCIMLKHLIQVHNSDITYGSDSPSDENKLRLPLNILPKEFNRNPSNDPVDPVDPANPVDPVDPVDPVNPVNPVDPVDPVDPVNPVDPVDPVDSDVTSSNNPEPSVERERAARKSWIQDYFSIKDDSLNSTCDICGIKKAHKRNYLDMKKIYGHLSTMHTKIYEKIEKERSKKWESFFERVPCSTDSTRSVNIKCKLCDQNPYDIKLRIYMRYDMETHLKYEHNVTVNEWRDLRNWRDASLTETYYDLIEEDKYQKIESIKKTQMCKKCKHQFPRSNLCIMLKHFIQAHPSDITFALVSPPKIFLPSHILPNGLLKSNEIEAIVNSDDAMSRSSSPSISGRSDVLSSLMEDIYDLYTDYWSTKDVDAASTMNPQSPTSNLSDSILQELINERCEELQSSSHHSDDLLPMQEHASYKETDNSLTEDVDAASTLNPQPSTSSGRSKSSSGKPSRKRRKISENASSDEDD